MKSTGGAVHLAWAITYRENVMDNNKKKKIVAIVLSTIISLAVSIVACIFEIPPKELGYSTGTETGVTQQAVI